MFIKNDNGGADMRLDIRKWGNSKAIRLPKKLLKEWDRESVAFDAEVKGQRLILTSIFNTRQRIITKNRTQCVQISYTNDTCTVLL